MRKMLTLCTAEAGATNLRLNPFTPTGAEPEGWRITPTHFVSQNLADVRLDH